MEVVVVAVLLVLVVAAEVAVVALGVLVEFVSMGVLVSIIEFPCPAPNVKRDPVGQKNTRLLQTQ